MKRLLEDIAAKRVDTVVVYKVDRLTRSLADFAKIVEQFDKQGISFVSVTHLQRSRAGLHGTNTLLWSGIDVDIPTEPTHSKCSPNGVRDAVLAAFQGHADGVILSRKYSEMKLTDLKGARAALHQLHLPT